MFKEGLGAAQQAAANRAKRVLERYGIDWYSSPDCLVWAPKNGVHNGVTYGHRLDDLEKLALRLEELEGQNAGKFEILRELRKVGEFYSEHGRYYQ